MMTYLGTMVVGVELVQLAVMGRTARYVSTNQAGNVEIVDEKLEGSLPMRLAAIRHLLQVMPPGMRAIPVHPGLHGSQFFEDVAACKEALVLETED